MARPSSMAAVATGLAVLVACGGDGPTAARAPLGTFELARVMGVEMPATVQDPNSQVWIRYSSGSLTLRGDSTYDVQFYGQLRDFGDQPISFARSATFHWNRETRALELVGPSGQPSYQGTASAEVAVIGLSTFGAFPGGSVQDFTFARTRD